MADALQQVNWYLDATDDPLLGDSVPAFDGGMFSNVRANLLQPNQSEILINCDVDKLGKIRTRRGTMLIAHTGATNPEPSGVAGTIIQGLTSYQTAENNYIVAANNKKLWAWSESGNAWVQIALGGTADHEEILIARTGAINQPTVSTALPRGGYSMGATVLVVDTISGPGIIGVGEKLYFTNNLRTDYWEYTVKAVGGGPPVTSITLEEPGLVFDVEDNWTFTVLRPAKVKHPTPGNRYAGGAGTGATGINIEVAVGFGAVATGEKFVIKSENITHTITTHTETAGDTSHINFSVDLQADWAADDVNVAVIFAQGNDQLFFSDGTGPIYGWKGGVPTSSTAGGGTLMQIGSNSMLDDFAGNFATTRTKPPQDVKSMIWFQNRLIAAAIATEPDAVYFSDYFNAGAWDADYQKTRIGGGESDPITGILAWSDLNLIVFKKNSCYLVNVDPGQNPNPDDPTLLVASFAVKQLHKLIGCPAPNTAVQVGGGSTTPGSDIFFLDGDKKVHSLRRVIAAETQQEVGQAMSLPIQDQLDTINLLHIDKAYAMYHNEHYILGFPSTRGLDAGVQNNGAVAYNMLTNSWCGIWNWFPTCFSRRTDLGSYSKLIFGDWRGGEGRVLQWYDDQSLDEETEASYEDFGFPLATTILTRAFTFGDLYAYKTGLSVEFEFDESVAEDMEVTVYVDGVPAYDPVTGSNLIAAPFSTLTASRLVLPLLLPFTLPTAPGLLRKGFDLQRYGTWRELQFKLRTLVGKLAIRSVRVTAFLDTVRLQTLPMTGIPAAGIPPETSSGGP